MKTAWMTNTSSRHEEDIPGYHSAINMSISFKFFFSFTFHYSVKFLNFLRCRDIFHVLWPMKKLMTNALKVKTKFSKVLINICEFFFFFWFNQLLDRLPGNS